MTNFPAQGTKPYDVALKAYIDEGKAIVTTQSGTSYTLVLADQGTTIELTNASAVTVTVPLNSSVAFPVGTLIEIVQYGAGQVTIAATGGVTINKPGGKNKTSLQFASAVLRKRATDEWMLEGDITT